MIRTGEGCAWIAGRTRDCKLQSSSQKRHQVAESCHLDGARQLPCCSGWLCRPYPHPRLLLSIQPRRLATGHQAASRSGWCATGDVDERVCRRTALLPAGCSDPRCAGLAPCAILLGIGIEIRRRRRMDAPCGGSQVGIGAETVECLGPCRPGLLTCEAATAFSSAFFGS